MKKLKNRIIILYLLVVLSPITNIHAAVPSLERAALVALYNSTDGNNWFNKTNWNIGDPCDNKWFAITCNISGNSITKIELGGWGADPVNDPNGNNLIGILPSELGNLINLQILDLSLNQLTGSIPTTLGNLSNLTRLSISYNKLSGNIPAELGNLNSLEDFWLGANQLSGNIPVELSNLTNLRMFEILSNKIHGVVPVEFNNLTNLTQVLMHYNSITENQSSLDLVALCNCNNLFYDWFGSQTIAPTNIQVTASSGSSLSINWNAINFLVGNGGYKVWMSDAENGIYTQVYQTNSKTVTAYTQSGLIQGQNYYFKLQSFTNPFSYNQNLVISEFSNPIISTTDITNSTSDIEIEIPSDIFPRQVVIVIGDKVSYKINLKNNGPHDAVAAGFRHNFPFGLINGSWSCTANSGGAICPSGQNSGNLDLTLDLPVNSILEFTFDATISGDIIPDDILTRGNGVNINDIIPSSLLVTATATPPDDVEDSDFASNIGSANIVELIFRSGFD